MADKITNDITLLFKTKLDEKSKQEVGKNLKGLLENASISFDEAETRRNLEPIVRMIQKLFDKAEIAFDADKLLTMPSRQALEEMAKMEVDQLQLAFDKALAKSGGIKIDFGDVDLSELAMPLKQIEDELSGISKKIADTTKKSVYEIEQSLKSISKNKSFKKIASPESIESTLIESSNDKRIHPSRASVQLEKARDLYDKSVKEDNPWVVQYKYLLDFVSKYEKLTHQAKTKIEAERPEFKQLYDMLSPKAGAVKISLEHYVDVAKGNELSEYKNQPWGRESTLKEIRDTLKGGISVKEGSGGDNNHKDNTTPPWADKNEDVNPKTPNTKVPAIDNADVNAAEQAKKVEEERLHIAEQRRIEQEKIAEMLKKEAEATPDTSVFNQKLFDGIEKLSNDIEVAFKSMMNGDIDEDQFDDQLAELRGEFLKQFKFDGKQRIDDYLAEKSDNMGEWNSKKIYDRLSKKLSPNDPSWPRIEASIVDGADVQVIAEQNDELEKQVEIIGLINSLVSSKNEKEKFAYLNMQTGDASKYIEGEYDSVSANEAKQLRNSDSRNFDSTLHTHPTKVAVPSPEDFKDQYLKNFDSFKKNFILATDEIAEIDFSQLTEQQAKDIYDRYNKQVIAKEKEYPSLKDMGVESVDINSTWTELEKQLNAVLPTMSDAVRSYIEDLKQTISADSALNTSVDDIHDILNEKAAEHFQDQDASIDASGIAEQVFDQTTGEIDAVQRMNRDILVQAIKDLGYDVSQVFRTYSIQDFVQQIQPQAQTEAAVSQQNIESIERETKAQEELNAAENQNPPAQDDTGVHNANVEAINKEIEAYKQREIERMSQGDITSLYWAAKHPETHDGELEAALQSNPNLISELTTQRDDLQGKLQPIQEMANKISQMSSIKDIPFDQLRQEAINVGQRLSTMYDQGITDTEEYIALQYKLIKIIDQIGASYGGVKGSGAKDTSELRRWVRNSIESEFGKDPVDEKVVEALWGQGKFSIMKTDAQTFNQRDMAGRLLGTDEIFVKSDSDDLSKINLIIEALSKISPITNTAKTSIDSLNDSLQEKDVIENSDNNSAEIATEKAETDAINQQNEALKENIDLKAKANAQNDGVVVDAGVEPDVTKSSASSTEVKASIDTEELRGLLNSITYNVKVIQDVEPAEGNKVSINADELRSVLDGITYNVKLAQGETDGDSNKIAIDEGILENVLNRITYDVKIAHDDADKMSNKIAIDESALEGVLNRVFGNILAPKDEGKKPEGKKEPWALEKTLNTTIKGVLDQIQTNTAKVDATSDTTGISEIKSILESINAKIVKGGVIATRGAVKQAGAQAVEPDVKRQAARSNMMKSIINDYKTMGKLAAQFASDGNLETKAMLENLKEEIRRKRASLNITMQENANLREKYSIAFEAEKKLLEAEKQQEKIDKKRKENNKAEKKRLADAKKLAQREAMVGKAGNAVGRAENIWMTAEGMEDALPQDFDAKLDDYYHKLDALRKKQAELKNSDTISEEQKTDLITQTNNVNKLTEEISGLIAEYQRLSGDNVDPTTVRANTIQPDANMDTYEQQLKNYVREITNGKGQIKGFNAETQTLTYTAKTGAHEFTTYTAAVRHLDDSLVSVRGATKKTETFLEATARKMKEISSYMSGMALISRVGQELRRGIQYVREIDLALTELKKVTDETEESYDKFLETAAKTADKVGSTIQKVVSSTADWARLGSVLAKLALAPLYSNI